jgi:hypothetical protein
VQRVQKTFVKHIALARERPHVGVENVRLFGFVELAAQRDIGRDQPLPLFGTERG